MLKYYFTIRWVDHVDDDKFSESLSDDAVSLFSPAHALPTNSDNPTVRHSTRIRPPTKLHGLPLPRSTRLPVSRRHQSTTRPQAIAPRD